ncbi:hypothetical protein Tco_0601826 [Tanacetum coccineum]
MGLRPNAPPGFQQTQPHQPTFGFNGHQQALYSAAIQNQSASSGSANSTWNMDHWCVLSQAQKSSVNNLRLSDSSNFSDVNSTGVFIQSSLRRTLSFSGWTAKYSLGSNDLVIRESEVLSSLVSKFNSCNKNNLPALPCLSDLAKFREASFLTFRNYC